MFHRKGKMEQAEKTIEVIELPKYKSELLPFGTDDTIIVSFVKSKPNWWWRFWQYFLFGFRWRDIEKDKSNELKGEVKPLSK